MTGLWLATYIALWLLVIGEGLLLVGALRQLGLIQRASQQLPSVSSNSPESEVRPLEFDGPSIGASLPSMVLETLTGTEPVRLSPASGVAMLLVFMSPMCEGCQHAAEPLNRVTQRRSSDLQAVVIMRGDLPACQAFLNVFPIDVPVVCDSDRSITMGFDVHRNPFGLLYDESGALVRKGVVIKHDDFLALLGEASAVPDVSPDIFPPVESANILASTRV